MGRWSSLHKHFVRVKTAMGLERFKVTEISILKLLQICWKSGKKLPMGRRSSLREHFAPVRTPIDLEQIEARKSRTATTSLSDFVWVIVGADLWHHFPKPKSALTSADDARCNERDPSNVSTPFPTWLNWTEVKWTDSKSCFKSAENWAASSLCVSGHRYTRISYSSKLVWVYSGLK